MEIFYCYGYGRLSREDSGKVESGSIKNQRDLIHDYVARRPELKLVMEGYDDGYTGTNFDRPHFQEMMAAIEAGKVNCVIVKDLSRFGRNHIDGGRYIAKLFPTLGVRFIAINDSYDSEHLNSASNIIMPVQNLFNDSFCRDTSEKIRSHLDVKRRNGDFIGSFAPFGYAKDPDNKNRLVIDPDAAQVVREIFAQRIAGQSCKSIADSLNFAGVLSPMEYKRAQGMNYKSGYRVHSKAQWSAVSVRRILQNEVYLGVLEQGKRTTPNYKVRAVVERPRDEWMRVENSHEAIISREEFELVARLMGKDTRMAPSAKTVYPLAGLVCCADCMGAMVRKTNTYDRKTYAYYICASHRGDKSVCSPHSVSERKLEAAVLEGINFQIQTVVELGHALEAVSRRPMRQVKAGRMERRLDVIRSELAKKEAIRDSLYRRYAAGEISREDFYEFKRIFTQDCEEAERAVEAQQRQIDELLANTAPDSPWIEYFRRFGHLDELNRDVAARLLDRVLVYEDGRVEIVFQYQEQFEQAMAVVQDALRGGGVIMPRKSRKEAIRAINAGQIPEIPAQRPESQPMEQIYQTVGYARLSVAETRDRKDGEALQNQKALLREYIQKKANLRLVDICEDNGQTGTNFQRAGFERMMELIRSGKANCIVVKDLSRFGRDHVEAGNFLENVFPYIGVRFISIGDGYDSADATTTDCLMVALRNLGNQIYSMDISRKSGSVLREKIRRGEFIGAYAAYGYIKDPDDRHHIVIDPEAAEVVREIFRRKLEGASNVAIVRRLNEAAIPSPCCYRHQKGILVDKRFEQPKPWTATTVKKILTCQTYIGDMVQGRRRSEFYAGKADRMLPREDWCVVEGTHEPIVSRKDFEAVQDILETARSRYQSRLGVYDHLGKSENILKGLVFCGDCGKPMVRYKQVSHGKSVTYHYLCPNYAALLDRSGCSYKFLREDVLMDALTEMISAEIRQTVDAAKLAQRLSMANRVQAENLSLELKRLNSELARAETAKKGAMEDYLSGLLSQEDYERLKRACAGETMRLKGRISALQTDYTKQTETLTQGNPWLQTFGGIDLEDGLTGPLAHSLIQRVTVYENDRIDVTLRYRDEKAQLLTAGDAGEVVA